MSLFIIWVQHKQYPKEKLDEAHDEELAKKMVNEYKVWLGNKWSIWYEEEKIK